MQCTRPASDCLAAGFLPSFRNRPQLIFMPTVQYAISCNTGFLFTGRTCNRFVICYRRHGEHPGWLGVRRVWLTCTQGWLSIRVFFCGCWRAYCVADRVEPHFGCVLAMVRRLSGSAIRRQNRLNPQF